MRELTDNVSGMFVYTCSQLTVLIYGNNFKFKRTFCSFELHNLDAVLSNDLGGVARLVHDEASAELFNALLHGCNSLIEGHVLLEVVV